MLTTAEQLIVAQAMSALRALPLERRSIITKPPTDELITAVERKIAGLNAGGCDQRKGSRARRIVAALLRRERVARRCEVKHSALSPLAEALYSAHTAEAHNAAEHARRILYGYDV